MVDMKGGYAGKLLRCNLSDKTITSESIDEQVCCSSIDSEVED